MKSKFQGGNEAYISFNCNIKIQGVTKFWGAFNNETSKCNIKLLGVFFLVSIYTKYSRISILFK